MRSPTPVKRPRASPAHGRACVATHAVALTLRSPCAGLECAKSVRPPRFADASARSRLHRHARRRPLTLRSPCAGLEATRHIGAAGIANASARSRLHRHARPNLPVRVRKVGLIKRSFGLPLRQPENPSAAASVRTHPQVVLYDQTAVCASIL
jgi:hypothetical protein